MTPTPAKAPAPIAAPTPADPPVTVLAPLDETPGKEPFLDPSTDVAKTYTSRAKIVRLGKRWATREATVPAHQVAPESVLFESIVVDRASSRVRVLCVSPNARVATWGDDVDLATVAKVPILVAPRASTDGDPNTPGIRLAAGTRVVRRGTGDPARIDVKTATIDGSGFVAVASIDVVFTPSASVPPAASLDGEIPTSATFYDGPNGAVVATVRRTSSDTLFVTVLGPPRAGQRLVRHASHDEMRPVVVGWVKESELKLFAKPEAGELGLRGGGPGGTPQARPMVKVTKGQRFADPSTGLPVGVATADARFACVEHCEAADATVAVPACAGALHVRLVR